MILRLKVKDPKKTTEMRAALVNGDDTLSETGAISCLPMNKITKYIDALPLSDAEKSALPDTSLQAVHQALDDDHQTFAREDDSPLGSVKARLAHSWPDSLSGDQLVKDDEGRTQLHAMPKAKRSSMIPDPWRTNPVGRFWDRLRGRDVTPRYLSRLTQEERESEQKWRTVGTIRRYILLLLTLSQTVVATGI